MANGDTKRSASSRPMLKLRISRSNAAKRKKNSDKRNNDSDVSESEASDTDSSDSAPVRRTRARTAVPSVSADTDSGDNYTPGRRSKQVRKNRGKNNKNSRYTKSKAKSNIIMDDDEDDDDEVDEANEDNEEEEEDEEERFVAQESTEESEDEKFVRRDTRSRKLATKNEENQKYVANNGKNNGNSDSESENDEEEEEEEEEDEQSQHETNNQDSDSDDSYKVAFKPTPRGSRRRQRHSVNLRTSVQQHTRRRCIKRPRYNEESDDSIAVPVRNRRKIKRRSYAEDSDEESLPTPEPEPQPGISISSRGRVRKMTPRARAYLLEAP